MTRPLAVLRPEPGNAATLARAIAAGFEAVSLPLFAVQAVAWDPADAAYDALVLTSANALRFGGAGLETLKHLPVLAVGPHTAAAARAAGFAVLATGDGGAAEIAALAATHGVTRALHLSGRDRTLAIGGPVAAVVPVYASVALPVAAAAVQALAGTMALLHSARAARRLGDLLDTAGVARAGVALAAFSPAIADAAGPGWAAVVAAATPDDAALLAATRNINGTRAR